MIKVGIVGAGHVAEGQHLPVLAGMPDVKLMWICDVDRKRASTLARLHQIAEVQQEIANCSDVDIALVAIPVGYRQAVMDQILDRRWHAFVEKPFAISCAEHDRILERAVQRNVEVGVGFQRRLYEGTRLAQRIVEKSLFGPVKRIWATEGFSLGSQTPGAAPWSIERAVAGGGVMIETSCHLIDQVFTICGVVDFELDRCELSYCQEIDFEGKTTGELRLADSGRCQFNIGVSWWGDLYNAVVLEFATIQLRVSIYPDDAWITDGDRNLIARLGSPGASGRIRLTVGRAFSQAVYAEWRAFIEQCGSRRPSSVAAAAARPTTRFIEECYRRQPPPAAQQTFPKGAA